MNTRLFIMITVLAIFFSLEVTAFGDFTDHGDGTVTDNITGLMWQQEDDDANYRWENAITYCEGLSLASYADWRLPNSKELSFIVDYSVYDPAIDETYFPNTNNFPPYWSSTTDMDSAGAGKAWRVGFGSGSVSNDDKTEPYKVRCVRGGQ